ncbi:hypothetical protein Daura_43690 [Dactylosporangium aurantiacum]|uniref:Uncharacterized protein n=1 Tax=Dactylosporangium aurantiacum TaxID=35754 RepID=A0A9Q9MI68_9ACTN|nr:hypothetical protein [Dactylosporangium aurantiacum]MDG6102318.1 hypothetical protein [Dactylosporangium aurantiacum]UWZ53381.1 hypothetical protein Daura_43690 [Dactylosporangium aurantiacum]
MTEQYAGALLYLVPVIVAAVVAFVVTRPEKDEASAAAPTPLSRRIPAQRTYPPPPAYPGGNRRAPAPAQQSPTLLHAALSSHLAAVSRTATSAGAPLSSPVVRPARLVSIRRPTRIPRRPLYQCPHQRP